MGLPYELWDHAISFLKCEPYTLLACCLASKTFRKHAERRLIALFTSTISLQKHTGLDGFMEEIRNIPGRARSLKGLDLWGSPPLTFFLIPHRLSRRLLNLTRLSIEGFDEPPHPPFASLWSIYGYAFPNVRHLQLREVQFPSAWDSFRLISSFHAV